MLKHIITACQRFIQEIIIAPPMATPAFASLQRSSDHQFGHLEHIDRFLPGRYDLSFMLYSITCSRQAVTDSLQARTRFEQPCFIPAERDVLPHYLAYLAPHLAHILRVRLHPQQALIALELVMHKEMQRAARRPD